MLAGKHSAHICLNDELIPKDLLPIINNTGTVNPINGPVIYQDQGCLIQSKIFIYVFLIKFYPEFCICSRGD